MQLSLRSVAIVGAICATLAAVACHDGQLEGHHIEGGQPNELQHQEQQQQQEPAVDLVSSIGVHMVIPYYHQDFPTAAIAPFAAKMTEVAVELMQYLDGLMSTMLSKKMRTSDWREVKRSIQAITAKLPKEGMDFAHQIGFYRYMLELTKEMLKESSVLEKRMWDARVGVNFSQLKDEIHSYFQTNIEAFQASPVSLYFGWAEATMDGRRASDVAIHWMAKVRLSGYSMLMTIARQLLNVAIAWNRVGGK